MASSCTPPSLPKPKDVYETEDVPSVGSGVVAYGHVVTELETDAIDRSGAGVARAFELFANKATAPTSDETASRKIRRTKPGGGAFFPSQTEFEILQSGVRQRFESPLQTFQRLQYETRQLLEDLEALSKLHKETGDPAYLEQDVSPSQLKEELSALLTQIEGLASAPPYQPFLNPRYEVDAPMAIQAGLTRKLKAEIEAYLHSEAGSNPSTKPIAPSSTATGNAGEVGGSANHITYELYYAPSTAKFAQLARVCDLEKRIAELEKVIGSTELAVPNTDLSTAVDSLHHKVTMLDSAHLDALSRKIQTVSQEIDAVLRKSESSSGAGGTSTLLERTQRDEKIDKLFEMMNRWDTTSQQLPLIISRLQALKTLHEESVSFSQAVSRLESEQAALSKLLKSNATSLSCVEESLKKNAATIAENIDGLEKRFAALAAKWK